jgi:thymidine phosphorylase
MPLVPTMSPPAATSSQARDAVATDALDVIRTKRDGGRLSTEQIEWFIRAYTDGLVADEQASALLMAIFLRGMEADELTAWTAAMIASGEVLDLSGVGRPTVDKHSTGGVGDKISLILCPLVAACGAAVPQLSGRGLGHTGGTLDKLEAIAGWRAQLSTQEMIRVLAEVGGVICGAGEHLAPADRKLYALRDVTGTVESIPLIASSIMSKKIAEGTAALVLDVKVGSGAFMPDVASARRLAETMVALGDAHAVRTIALLTDMNTPLGRACGNAMEVAEAVEVLQGGGPSDVVAETLALAAVMVEMAGLDADPARVLASGRALECWETMIRAQGGDPTAPLPEAAHRADVLATEAGYVQRLDARAVGVAAWRLGAGRARKEDSVDPAAGVICLAKPGDAVDVGQVLLELHADRPDRFDGARAALAGAIDIGQVPPPARPLIIERIEV